MTALGITSWVDGRLVPPGTPAISPEDRGLVGDGVFEAIKVVDGVPFAMTRHLDRLLKSADPLGIEVDLDAVAAGTDAVVAVESVRARPHWLRITVTGGPAAMGKAEAGRSPTVMVAAAPLPQWGPACDAVIVPWTRNERGALAGLKTVSYIENGIALRWAHSHGADEGIFANTQGNLCEGSGTNVFVVVDGVAVTPPLTAGALDGITRQLLLEWLPEIEVRDLPLSVLNDCTEAFVTSTSRDVHPVGTIDGRHLPEVAGKVTAAVIDCFATRSAADPNP